MFNNSPSPKAELPDQERENETEDPFNAFPNLFGDENDDAGQNGPDPVPKARPPHPPPTAFDVAAPTQALFVEIEAITSAHSKCASFPIDGILSTYDI